MVSSLYLLFRVIILICALVVVGLWVPLQYCICCLDPKCKLTEKRVCWQELQPKIGSLLAFLGFLSVERLTERLYHVNLQLMSGNKESKAFFTSLACSYALIKVSWRKAIGSAGWERRTCQPWDLCATTSFSGKHYLSTWKLVQTVELWIMGCHSSNIWLKN